MEFIPCKTVVSSYKPGGWFGCEYNMNIYKGCCHGCIYCDSRSECYHVENFDQVRAKENALEVIEHDLRSRIRTGVVMTGSMSDPYNPFEKELELTRGALKLLDRYRFGVAVNTKSDLILRDLDRILAIQEHSPVLVNITITTADDALCRQIEPNVCPTSRRIDAIRRLSGCGIPCNVLLMPVLPFLEDNDENVLSIVRMAAEAGARSLYSGFGMTLRLNQRDHYYARLDEHFPGLREQYQRRYGNRYNCSSPRARSLWELFSRECDRLGLLYRMQDIIRLYRQGYWETQMSLFGN